MDTLALRGEYIKLGQAIKAAGYVESGVDAKDVIIQGMVQVNGETCTQRGKKCVAGDVITFEGQTLTITE